MFPIISKLPQVKTNIFTTMSQLASEFSAINLSQGFPDYNCSPQLIELVNKHMVNGHNQYEPMPGVLALREKVSEKIKEIHQSTYNPETEITITAGGTQTIYTVLAAIIQPDDEVIIFEPAYDCYAPSVLLQGGLVKSLELSPPDYTIDWAVVKKQ